MDNVQNCDTYINILSSQDYGLSRIKYLVVYMNSNTDCL
jgi:hypothetical protein